MISVSHTFGEQDNKRIFVYGTWFGSQFNLWLWAKNMLWGEPALIQYVWGGQVYNKFQYDNWPFTNGASYTDNNGSQEISVSISPDESGVYLKLVNIKIAGGDVVVNLNPARGFYTHYNPDATFCGYLSNLGDSGLVSGTYTSPEYGASDVGSHLPLRNANFVLDGLPITAWGDNYCDY